MRLPYRQHLTAAPDAETLEVLARLRDTFYCEPPDRAVVTLDLNRLVETANELVLWYLASLPHHFDRIDPEARSSRSALDSRAWLRVLGKTLDRALADADAEGVVWTPVLDALAGDFGVWTIIANDSVKRPSAERRAQKLAAWLAEVEDSAAIRGLLSFQALAIHEIVAGHIRVSDPEVFLQLRLTPSVAKRLTDNSALTPDLKSLLVERAYEIWKAAYGDNDELVADPFSSANAPEVLTLTTMLARGFALPPSVRADALALALNEVQDVRATHAVRFLLSDRSTSADELVDLARYVSPVDSAHIMAHPNCPDALWDRLILNPTHIEIALTRPIQLPADRVAALYAHLKEKHYSSFLRREILHQVNGSLDIWLGEITSASPQALPDVFVKLATNPCARQHPRIREKLLMQEEISILHELLSDSRPEEFEHLVLSIYRQDPPSAILYLKHNPVPPGTPFPHRLAELLLNDPDSSVRLFGITLLSRFRDAAEQPSIEHAPDLPDIPEGPERDGASGRRRRP